MSGIVETMPLPVDPFVPYLPQRQDDGGQRRTRVRPRCDDFSLILDRPRIRAHERHVSETAERRKVAGEGDELFLG